MLDLEFEFALRNILDQYTEDSWRNEPLDSDEVENLINILRNQLNLINGNITAEEYIKREEY